MIDIETGGIFADGLSDSVTYNNGTVDASIDGILDFSSEGSAPGSQATILVKKAQVPAPEHWQTITIDGDAWHIAAESKGKDFILDQTDDTFLLRISKDDQPSSWRR